MRNQNNFIRLFESRKSHIDSRIKRDYIDNGIATINCCISNYHDIISTYSAKGQESLNFDFIDYLEDSAEPIPDEYPLVLNIIGNCLSDEEKKTITETISEEFSYKLGRVEKEQEREFKVLIFMVVGSIIAGLLLTMTDFFEELPREIFVVLFCFWATECFNLSSLRDVNFAKKNVWQVDLQVSKLFFRTPMKNGIIQKMRYINCMTNSIYRNKNFSVIYIATLKRFDL